MFVIFKRELRAIFLNIKNVACLALLAVTEGILFVLSNMTAGSAEIYSVLSAMTLASAVVIPALVCDTFARERESKTFICALPITAGGLLFGKGLAFFVSVLVANAPIFLFPIILGLKGGLALGVSYPSILMFLLFECFIIALSLLFATLFRKLWKLWTVLYAVLIAAFIIGAAAVLLPMPARDILRLVSPFKQFDHTVFASFDLASVLYYTAFTALFLYIAIRRTRCTLSSVKSQKKNTKRMAVSLILSVACLAVNVSAVFVPLKVRQLDISANRLYGISESTEKYLASLDKDITVYLINAVGLPKLGNSIERYCGLSNRITLKHINTSDDLDILEKYGVDTSSVANYSMIVASEERHKYITSDQVFCYPYNDTYFSPSVFENAFKQYQAYYQVYVQQGQTGSSEFQQLEQTLQSMAEASTKLSLITEDVLTEAIAYVAADKIPTIYFADGSGEQSTGNRLNLKTDKIPDDATLVIINTPKEDYSEEAVSELLGFTNRGGRLIALTNEDNLKMPNLMHLLECYGISAEGGSLGDGVTAKIDASNSVFTSGGFSEIKLDGAYELVAKEIDGIKVSPLLTVSIKAVASDESDSSEEEKKEETTVTKNVGMISYENNIPKLLWISGGESFYKSNEELDTYDTSTEEGKAVYVNYTNLLTFLQISMLAMKENFSSGLLYPAPKQFNTDIIAVDASDATLMGTLFIVLYPLAIAGGAFMLSYTRKKKSQAALEDSRQ